MRYVLAACLVALLTGCGSDSLTVKGSLTLDSGIDWLDGGASDDGSLCEGTGGYDDISEGADVVVTDSKGERVGIGSLGVGKGVDGACVFRFTVDDVDSSSSILAVEVTHRGEVSFKRSEAADVALTLG